MALANLANDKDFQTFVEALGSELQESIARLVSAADAVSVHREQGRAEMLRTILESAAAARSRVPEMREQQQSKARQKAGHPGTWTG